MTSAYEEAMGDLICWQIALEKKMGQCRFESQAWEFYAEWWGGTCHAQDELRETKGGERS